MSKRASKPEEKKPEKSAIEKKLERFMDEGDEQDEKPLPDTVQLQLFKNELAMWKNTLKHTREMYQLACSVKDEQRKQTFWDEALNCMKWKEALERKIAALEKRTKKVVEVTEGNPVIDDPE